ncbi:hypothetical protein DPMN_031985 [Dreissena polymorpha]|uniref:Mab-21-like HhH/H2TH-like domain-containing protein n=1 Tax=Dreissena polymorpha TaxID=45954 RepID=A0A9D4RHJ9_DREPO|nr:hypothetical protein DPMN_031985 [Dreissena polymorpha]
MIVKDVLNPQKKEITSYTLKNIVLWLAENNHQTVFDKRSLFYCLHKAMISLKAAIDTLQLKYYMIPERNLMAGCEISDEQRQTWIATIAEMIDEGPRVLLRLPKIRRAIIAHPEPLQWFNKMRTMHEMVTLISLIRIAQCEAAGVAITSDSFFQMTAQSEVIILSEIFQRMIMKGSRVNGQCNLRLRVLM